jgi:hypothetical protein
MNYFAHAFPFLDDPYFAVGTGVPDWLTVVDRRVRIRLKHAQAFVSDPESVTASVARGIIQHIRDDARFHQTRAFGELTLELSARCRDHLDDRSGLRPAFLGHLMVEVLLDATLIVAEPDRLKAYYEVLDTIDPAAVQNAVNRIATRPAQRLAGMIDHFRRHRILSDYLEDAKLLVRLNQVMHRAGLAELPESFVCLFPHARQSVERRKAELLDGVPTGET